MRDERGDAVLTGLFAALALLAAAIGLAGQISLGVGALERHASLGVSAPESTTAN